MNSSVKKILNNQSGVAIIMVITAVTILTALMIDFTFESKVQKIRGNDLIDREQAKLNAKAALKLAMVRIELYQQAFNLLQKNEDAKDYIDMNTVNQIWNIPFMYPLPITKNMGIIQRDMITKFHETTLLDGSMNLMIQNISNSINLNLLRLSFLDKKDNEDGEEGNRNDNGNEEEADDLNLEETLREALTQNIERKGRDDELFFARNSAVDIEELIDVLKYYISDENSFESRGLGLSAFQQEDKLAKFAPLSSYSELYFLPKWTDELIELLKNQFTVYGAIMIDLNKITDKMIRSLFPEITDEQLKEFFIYRDDPKDPHPINTIEDFKQYFVTRISVISEEDFDKLIKSFEAKGIKFGPSPTLFRVIASGTQNRVTYSIEAIVSLPSLTFKDKKDKKKKDGDDEDGEDDYDEENENELDGNGEDNENDEDNGEEDKEKKKKPTVLLRPRIIEIFVN